MQRLISVRRRSSAFGRGSFELLMAHNHRILAFLRRHEADTVLCVFNLAASAQAAILDLSTLDGAIPIDMFAGSVFPRIGKDPYVFTLGPHDFFWFRLRWL
jgi:maltose alpha-D-glucosyltransferase/alpha-amylase